MAYDDIRSALQDFTSGVRSYQLSRSIQSANDQVQSIRASTDAETKKRAALQDVSNGLVMQMAAQGTPATTMDAVKAAFPQTSFANASAMNQQGVLTGNQDLQDMAKQQQTFEEDPILKRIQATQGSKAFQQMMELNKFKEQQDEFTTRAFTKLSDNLDASKEVRSAFGRGEQVSQQGGRLMALVNSVGNSPDALNKLAPQQINELASSLAQMVKNGVATKDEVANFAPKTSGMTEAGIQSWLTNKPTPADVGSFAKLYLDTAKREIANADTQRENMVMQRATGNKLLMKRDPEQFKATVANRLGPDFSKDDVVVNPDTGQVGIKGLEEAEPYALNTLRKAYTQIYSNNPQAKQDAQTVFNTFGVSPNLPYNKAAAQVQWNLRHGVFGPRKAVMDERGSQ